MENFLALLGNFRFKLKQKSTAAGKLWKILKKLFSKSFLSRAPQSAKLPLRFKLATPRRQFGRSKIFPSGEIFAPSPRATFGRAMRHKDFAWVSCIPTQPSRKRAGFNLERGLHHSAIWNNEIRSKILSMCENYIITRRERRPRRPEPN